MSVYLLTGAFQRSDDFVYQCRSCGDSPIIVDLIEATGINEPELAFVFGQWHPCPRCGSSTQPELIMAGDEKHDTRS